MDWIGDDEFLAAFEKQDQDKPPPKQAVVFVGSSSIRLWDLAKSFSGQEVINRGFGGSQLADPVHFAPRLVLKHEPRLVVLYAGDNAAAASTVLMGLLATTEFGRTSNCVFREESGRGPGAYHTPAR